MSDSLTENKFELKPGQRLCPDCKGTGLATEGADYKSANETGTNACPTCKGLRWVPDEGGEPAQLTELELFEQELRGMSAEMLMVKYDQLSTNLLGFEASDERYPRMKAMWLAARIIVLSRMKGEK